MIITKAPVRISFVGGGSDLKSFYEKNGGGAVVSTAVDKFVYVTVNKNFDDSIKVKYSQTEKVDNINDLKHDRSKAIFQKLGIHKAVEVSSLADIPSRGTGLGSSSSFTVAMLHAMHAYKKESISYKQLAEEACEVEINMLKEPIGKQDQHSAAFGGFNLIEFNPDDTVNVEPIICQRSTLQKIDDRLLVFYTGITRSATNILAKQKKNVEEDRNKIGNMKKMVKLAYVLKQEIEKNNYESFGKILHENWLLKKQMAAGISTGVIDDWYEKAIKAGAEGGKLMGAGGGGFLLFYAPIEKHDAIKQALNLRHFDLNFESEGSKVIFCS